ncbi:MAG: hypothetical protein QNJ42_18675 [Crocosphaera sp.]|nr:hypothetical protein [Crocosphaera sp.]
MLIQIVHLILSIAVVIALWNMSYKDTSGKILITAFISGNFILIHYYKQLFKVKIKEVINREVEVQNTLIESHQRVLDELKESNWEKLNAKQSELILSQQEIQRLQSDNERLNHTLDNINGRYYSLVDKLGSVLDEPPSDSPNS